MIKPRILLALSGGVDSSVSAYLLKKQGYEFIAVTFKVYESFDYRNYPLNRGINDAIIIAEKLGIPYFVIDICNQFNDLVIRNFIDSYQKGQTPNPCSLCNYVIKWSKLIELADIFDCEYVATGHYASVNQLNDRYYISISSDVSKDQSFFLWRLSQDQLRRTIFPLSGYTKQIIKQMASETGLTRIAQKQESYNICFIPDGDYRRFLDYHLGFNSSPNKKGYFISESEQIIGEYSGIWNYTVGQKRGIVKGNIEEHYVLELDEKQNVIRIGKKESLYKNTLLLNPYNLMKYCILPQNIDLNAKLNYRGLIEKCTAEISSNGLKIKFENPVLAVAPGQSIAIYENNDLVGGGVVTAAFNS